MIRFDKWVVVICVAILVGVPTILLYIEDCFALKINMAYRVKVNPVVAGVFQSGKTLNLCIQRSTDAKRFDFDDDTWKSAGWTTKTVTLTEDTDVDSPSYYYDWAYPVSNVASADVVYSFHVKGAGFAFYDIQDIAYEWLFFTGGP